MEHVVKKRRDFQEIETVEEPLAVEETATGKNLRTSLEEINNYPGVVGYILRNTTSAAIDLKDPSRIIDYAILSSSALEASKDLSNLFNLGEVKDILIEGKDTKMLAVEIDENKISVFMEKNADAQRISRRLHQ
jgi:predicted regulator of Ras-like GTPase activity (Roadblock/LC7/MglB family)